MDRKAADYKELYSTQTSSSTASGTPREMTPAPYGRVAYLYQNPRQNQSQAFNAIFGKGNSFESIFELSFNWNSNATNFVKSTSLGSFYGTGNTNTSLGPNNNGVGLLTVRPDIVSDVKAKSFSYFQHQYDLRHKCYGAYVRGHLLQRHEPGADRGDRRIWKYIQRDDDPSPQPLRNV
jgi:hypothetical protein